MARFFSPVGLPLKFRMGMAHTVIYNLRNILATNKELLTWGGLSFFFFCIPHIRDARYGVQSYRMYICIYNCLSVHSNFSAYGFGQIGFVITPFFMFI